MLHLNQQPTCGQCGRQYDEPAAEDFAPGRPRSAKVSLHGRTIDELQMMPLAEVRAFAMESAEEEKFNSFSDEFLRVMKKNVKYVEITSPFLELFGVVSASFILWYGGFQVLSDTVSQGTFIAFIVGLFMMYTPLRLLFKIYTNIQSSLAGAERVFSVLDMREEKIKEGTLELSGFKNSIE